MKFKLQLQIIADDETVQTFDELLVVEKHYHQLADLGLTLSESKALLKAIQQPLVESQIQQYVDAHRHCERCGQQRPIKGYHSLIFRTLFGNVPLRSPRLHHCDCHAHDQHTFSVLTPLLPQHQAPELLFLETQWASLMPYGVTAERLKDVLPIDHKLNAATIKHHVETIAERDDAELGDERVMYIDGCPNEWGRLPRPDGPITVGIDGGYVRSWEEKKTNFEVMVGKSVPSDGPNKYFGLVQSYDTKPKRRVFEVLKSQGMQANQQVTFLSDGEETVHNLQLYLNPESEHLLDWFHVTMRITVLGQYVKGLIALDKTQGEAIQKSLESTKWYLWHGNVYEALEEIQDIEMLIYAFEERYVNFAKLAKAVEEFHTYIERNQAMIPNYGERWRYGETISTAFVESSVNAVINKRFCKKQQMQWTKKGAHLLLQTRTRVLNGELGAKFEQWYPGFKAQNDNEDVELAA